MPEQQFMPRGCGRPFYRPFGLAALFAAGLLWPAAAGAGTVSEMCTTGPVFNLETATGHIDTPDGNSVFMWSYTASTPVDLEVPGPILCVTQGETVTVNLTNNNLPEPVSIVFPGQSDVTASGGSPGLFTREAATGQTVSYSFVAAEPGTYLYESGTNPHKQVEMGLYGALIIRPAGHPDWAYNDPSTAFDPDQEYLVLIHEVDSALHEAVENGTPFDGTLRHDNYWFVNGRSFPDSILPDHDGTLPHQPYGALVEVNAVRCAVPGPECVPLTDSPPALIRYANAGLKNHPFHPHGNNFLIIARDGRLLGGVGYPGAVEAFGKTVGSGETYDLLARWVNEQELNSATNPLPIPIPENQNLTFKDNRTFYSGSPYLGEQGELPAAVTQFNECGEFYFPWHSHALNEFENFDEGFGGLATMWRVEPSLPNSCP